MRNYANPLAHLPRAKGNQFDIAGSSRIRRSTRNASGVQRKFGLSGKVRKSHVSFAYYLETTPKTLCTFRQDGLDGTLRGIGSASLVHAWRVIQDSEEADRRS